MMTGRSYQYFWFLVAMTSMLIMVTAAPMSGEWYHQHFGASKGPLRLTPWFGPIHPGKNSRSGAPGSEMTDYGAIDLRDGGTAVPYDMEDPYLRKEFEQNMTDVGTKSRMEEELYVKPNAPEPKAAE